MHSASMTVRPPSCATFLVARRGTAGSVSALEQALARTLDAHWRCWGLALPVTKGGLGRTGLITARVIAERRQTEICNSRRPRSQGQGCRKLRRSANFSQVAFNRSSASYKILQCFLGKPFGYGLAKVWLRFGYTVEFDRSTEKPENRLQIPIRFSNKTPFGLLETGF